MHLKKAIITIKGFSKKHQGMFCHAQQFRSRNKWLIVYKWYVCIRGVEREEGS